MVWSFDYEYDSCQLLVHARPPLENNISYCDGVVAGHGTAGGVIPILIEGGITNVELVLWDVLEGGLSIIVGYPNKCNMNCSKPDKDILNARQQSRGHPAAMLYDIGLNVVGQHRTCMYHSWLEERRQIESNSNTDGVFVSSRDSWHQKCIQYYR